jgi:hypothetical protein
MIMVMKAALLKKVKESNGRHSIALGGLHEVHW